jgi:hypothetical protein
MLPLASGIAVALTLLLGASGSTSTQQQPLLVQLQPPKSLLSLASTTSVLLLLLLLLVQRLLAASLQRLGTDTSQLAVLMQLAHDAAAFAPAAVPAPAAAAALLHATVRLLRCWFRSKLRLPMLAVRTRLVDTAAATSTGGCCV